MFVDINCDIKNELKIADPQAHTTRHNAFCGVSLVVLYVHSDAFTQVHFEFCFYSVFLHYSIASTAV